MPNENLSPPEFAPTPQPRSGKPNLLAIGVMSLVALVLLASLRSMFSNPVTYVQEGTPQAETTDKRTSEVEPVESSNSQESRRRTLERAEALRNAELAKAVELVSRQLSNAKCARAAYFWNEAKQFTEQTGGDRERYFLEKLGQVRENALISLDGAEAVTGSSSQQSKVLPQTHDADALLVAILAHYGDPESQKLIKRDCQVKPAATLAALQSFAYEAKIALGVRNPEAFANAD